MDPPDGGTPSGGGDSLANDSLVFPPDGAYTTTTPTGGDPYGPGSYTDADAAADAADVAADAAAVAGAANAAADASIASAELEDVPMPPGMMADYAAGLYDGDATFYSNGGVSMPLQEGGGGGAPTACRPPAAVAAAAAAR